MKQYRVIALYCPNGASTVFKSGDIVKESDFAEGTFAEKLKAGFLELAGETPEPPAQDPPPASELNEGDLTASIDETTNDGTEENQASDIAGTLKKAVEESTSESVENVPHGTSDEDKAKVEEIKVKIDDISIRQIKDDLKKAGVTFDKDASKEVLFDLWQKRELTETI